jgi:hypothetical protein
MSSENIELLRRLQEEWNHDDTLRPDKFHPNVEFLPLRAATEGAYRGRAGIENFVRDTREIFDKFEMRYQFEDLGERVLTWGTIHVRAKGSGIETDIDSGGLFEFRDGQVVRWEDFGSKAKALQAAKSHEQAERRS